MINNCLYNFWYSWSKSQSTNFLNKIICRQFDFHDIKLLFEQQNDNSKKNIIRKTNKNEQRWIVFFFIEFFLYLQYYLVRCTNPFYQVLTIFVNHNVDFILQNMLKTQLKMLYKKILWSIVINKWSTETNSKNHKKQNNRLYNDCTIKLCES